MAVIAVTPTLDTSAYAANDVLFAPNLLFRAGTKRGAMLRQIHVLDEADSGSGIELIFLNAEVALGTLNAAPDISDANAAAIVARYQLPAASYLDIGGSKIQTATGLLIPLPQTVWVAGITLGTPTYAASSLKFRFTID